MGSRPLTRGRTCDAVSLVQLEDGNDVVIVEGKVEAPQDPERTKAALAVYAAKYPDFDVASQELGNPHCLRPRVAHAWLEAAVDETRSRWEPVPEVLSGP